jgi:proteic killer suppression protein
MVIKRPLVSSFAWTPKIVALDDNNAKRYYFAVTIKTFKCVDTEALFGLRRVARFANIERSALRKLKQLDLARRIEDLRAPPANRLEPLKGDRAGQWSVRVNDQFRICFRWTGTDAEDVEIVDYH